jgi:hypothetical protein
MGIIIMSTLAREEEVLVQNVGNVLTWFLGEVSQPPGTEKQRMSRCQLVRRVCFLF